MNDNQRAIEVSTTIMEQLGGAKFRVMTGAKEFGYSVHADGCVNLTFKIGKNAKKVSHVSITLKHNDTYTVEFLKVSIKSGRQVVSEHKEIYCDMLEELVAEQTGLATRL